MAEKITVHVVKYASCKNLMMRYRDSGTGKQVARSSGTDKKQEALKAAAKWEAELQEGRYSRDNRMGWDEFRRFWEDAKLPSLKASTAANYASTMNAFGSLCRPQRIADLTTQRVTTFATELRRKGLSESSVARHLRAIKAMARWAHRQELLTALPCFDMPTRGGAMRMKGRPITTEEFERMLAAVERKLGEKAADSWKLLLRGLWWSGLRLSEVLALRWDHRAGGVSIVLDGRRSVLAFDGESQKNGKVQLVPLAPEVVELLEPHQRDHGFVFTLLDLRGGHCSRNKLAVGRKLSAIGEAAGVVTDPEKGRTATAHDLRRAFGYRWSRRVMPATLKELMRHASIETTMTYYVGQNAQTTSGELWDALGKAAGKVAPEEPQARPPETTKAPANAGAF